MESGLKFIFDIILWFFVPISLITAIIYTATIFRRVETDKQKDASKAGFWGGVTLFVAAFVYHVNIFIREGFPNLDIYQGFSLQLAILGAIGGFVAFLGGQRFASSRLSGWVTLALAFLEFYALFGYLFIRLYNEMLLSLMFGIFFGVLVHFAFPHEHNEEF